MSSDGHPDREPPSGDGSDARSPAEQFTTAAGDVGPPDVRLVVYRSYPVFALARLPTEASDGTVGLQGGAVGVRLSVADGTALGACQPARDRAVTSHPDTGASLADLAVPDWPGVVAAATDAVDAPGICHSVDVAVGAGGDPEVVAVERRAGLCLRGSPTSGLVRRLEYVGTLPTVDPDAPVTRRLDRVEGLDDPEYALGVLPEGEDVRLAGDAGERRETALASGGTG